METMYWALEYIKVLLAYIMIMFVWPSVMFRGYLRNKSRGVRFAFCATVQVVLINTVVLGLGLLHILYGWLVALLFYGSFFGVLLYRHPPTEEQRQMVLRIVTGTYGIRLFVSDMRSSFRAWRKKRREVFQQSMRGHIAEYVMLAAVILFGMVYFTYGAFYDHSYGFGDMYTHHSWIYGLQGGKAFSMGIYPEAMHCFIYSIRVVFGVSVYSTQLFLAGIHVAVLFISIYLMLKELYAWRGTAILVLTLFLTIDQVCINEIFSMSRLQWTLPQEFGFYTQFVCALFLQRCLKSDFTDMPKGILKKLKILFTDENLLLFMMALAASLAIHFYTTIMAFFLCLAVALFHFPSIFRKKRLLPLIAAVVGGLTIAVAPMGIALAEGIPFQGSIGWAVNVINGTDEQEAQANGITIAEDSGVEVPGSEQESVSEAGRPSEAGEQPTEPAQTAAEISFIERLQSLVRQTEGFFAYIGDCLRTKAEIIYKDGYVTLYRQDRAAWILIFTVLGLGFWLCYRLIAGFAVLVFHKRTTNHKILHFFDGYPVLVLMSFFFMLLYASYALGLPQLVAGARLCSMAQVLILAVIAIPLDIFFGTLAQTRIRRVLPFALFLCIGGIYFGTQELGIYHGYLYNELTRYNSVVKVTNEIMQSFPENSYTVVSPTDELYHVMEKGRHEELYDFVRKVRGENYTIPTEYVFLYVEKKPIQYAQSHFLTGPGWLAAAKYPKYYDSYVSEGENISAAEISEEAAEEELVYFTKLSQSYSDLENRTRIESKAYLWFQKFSALYPQETTTYYEDEDFVCYLIRQNPYRLFQLEVQ